MTLVLPAAGVLLTIGLLGLWVRRGFLVTTVDGSSMEPALRSGDRVLVRRTKRVRAGQVIVFAFPDPPNARAPVAKRDRQLLVKRAVVVPGDRVPVEWEYPDIHEIAGTAVPPGSLVVLGDNRATSWDSRHYGFVHRDRFIGVVTRRLPRSEISEVENAHRGSPPSSHG
ncbi:S26 family signal peptidase [Streptosporangium subroseum]|uniref:peptidase S26 family protein n=1 Tax=Streptosporangium subroseum TaxID=106412 RepID=UPI003438B3D8